MVSSSLTHMRVSLDPSVFTLLICTASGVRRCLIELYIPEYSVLRQQDVVVAVVVVAVSVVVDVVGGDVVGVDVVFVFFFITKIIYLS